MEAEKKLTGYPSIDKPWLKYYTEEAINAPLPECTIYEYLWENNKDHLDDVALIYFGKKITYGELFENIDKTARAFSAIGVKQGDIVTIFSTNTPETVYCIYALNYIGAISNVEYVTESSKEAISAIEKCNSKVIVILDIFLSKFSDVVNAKSVKYVISLPLSAQMPFIKKLAFRLKTKAQHLDNEIPFYKMLSNAKNENCDKPKYIKDAPAVIVHSGGTTGTPKGVVLSNDNLIYVIWAFQNNGVGFKKKDKYLYEIPPFHSFGMTMGVCCSLCIGMETILAVKFNDAEAIQLFVKNKPNHIMCGVSTVMNMISDKRIKKMDLSFFETCGMGGGALPNSHEIRLEEFLKHNHAVAMPSIGYGMSELASAACTELNRYYGKVGSVGIPLPKANVKVLDIESGKELKYDEDGELCFATPGLMLEYFKNEKETNDIIFTDNEKVRWIHTGDVGHIDEDGFVFITGRIKRIYPTRAEKNGTFFKLFPDYVTNIINQVNGVKESAVVCIEDLDYKNIGIAYVVLTNPAKEKEPDKQILEHLQTVLPTHSIPKRIYYIEKLPLTPVGKVDYRALEQEAENKE